MMLMKWLTLIFWLSLSVTLIFSQSSQNKQSNPTHPDLSGTWTLSKYEVIYGLDETINIRISMFISQTEREVRINRKIIENGEEYNQDHVYYSDERGERNSLFVKDNKWMETKTKWDKDKLVSQGLIKGEIGSNRDTTLSDTLRSMGMNLPVKPIKPDKYTQKVIEEWELSSDGKTLTNITTRSPMKMNSSGWKGLEKTGYQIRKIYIRTS
jgi:hypothetical protein